MDVLRLEARRRVRNRQVAIDAEAIARARRGLGDFGFPPAVAVALERYLAVALRAFQKQRHLACVRRPEPKSDALPDRLGAERHAVDQLGHAEIAGILDESSSRTKTTVEREATG